MNSHFYSLTIDLFVFKLVNPTIWLSFENFCCFRSLILCIVCTHYSYEWIDILLIVHKHPGWIGSKPNCAYYCVVFLFIHLQWMQHGNWINSIDERGGKKRCIKLKAHTHTQKTRRNKRKTKIKKKYLAGVCCSDPISHRMTVWYK